MLNCCITGRQLLEVFTSLLGRVLISIQSLLVSVKCRLEDNNNSACNTVCIFTMQQRQQQSSFSQATASRNAVQTILNVAGYGRSGPEKSWTMPSLHQKCTVSAFQDLSPARFSTF